MSLPTRWRYDVSLWVESVVVVYVAVIFELFEMLGRMGKKQIEGVGAVLGTVTVGLDVVCVETGCVFRIWRPVRRSNSTQCSCPEPLQVVLAVAQVGSTVAGSCTLRCHDWILLLLPSWCTCIRKAVEKQLVHAWSTGTCMAEMGFVM